MGHPLQVLRLSANDIKDKSKADWIVKTIAVIQITRLIFDLITRGIGGQSVTQLEIATVSFSGFAIFTHFANWWKPKDVSQPTKLHTVIDQGTEKVTERAERTTHSFFKDLWFPRTTPHRLPQDAYADTMSLRIRIRNDELWMGTSKRTNLAWLLLSASYVVFGGVHCAAWRFQFPTRAEQLAWRTAALVSTALPVLSLAGSSAITRLRPPGFVQAVTEAVNAILEFYDVKLLEAEEDWWNIFTTEVSSPVWEELVKTLSGVNKDDEERLKTELQTMGKLRSSLRSLWQSRLRGRKRDEERLINTIWRIGNNVVSFRGTDFDLRSRYEIWIKSQDAFRNGRLTDTLREKKLKFAVQPYYEYQGDEGLFDWVFARCYKLKSSEAEWFYREKRRKHDHLAQVLSRLLNTISAFFYTIARALLLAIMFSSLWAAPDGIYDTPDWTRFVSSFS